jgi:hypothetical protein
MALKNYKSQSALPNIFTAIEKTLSSHGARQVIRDYDNNGKISSISFLIYTSKGPLGIRLPARFDRVEKLFQEQGIRYQPDQPYRTAWATLRDWVDAQMALVDWEMVKPEEVFLPYAVTPNGETYFEVIENSGFLLTGGGIVDSPKNVYRYDESNKMIIKKHSINDLKQFEHGQEGTHYACQKMINELGGSAGCCGCNKHNCHLAKTQIDSRLEYLRKELRAGVISYSELAELQSLIDYIDPGDTELLEAAGVPEKL